MKKILILLAFSSSVMAMTNQEAIQIIKQVNEKECQIDLNKKIIEGTCPTLNDIENKKEAMRFISSSWANPNKR